MRIPEGIAPQAFIHGEIAAYMTEANRQQRAEIAKEIEAAIRADERERMAKLAIADDLCLITGECAGAWIRGQTVRSQGEG